MYVCRKVTPACKNGTAAVNAGEICKLTELCYCVVKTVADGHKTCCDKAYAALCALCEIGKHFLIGAACFVAH